MTLLGVPSTDQARRLVPVATLGARDAAPAIVEPGRGFVSYADLDQLADDVARRWRALGLQPGSRIGLYLRRSTDAVAAMLGTLGCGAAYVPVDPRAPAERIAETHIDCDVSATLVEEGFEVPYRDALARLGATRIAVFPVGPVGLGRSIGQWALDDQPSAALPLESETLRPDLACILYTSGTTGRPKGWMMSRDAIDAHVGWCHDLLRPTRQDVFANHAQFSFGMSLFDIYSSLRCGAPLVLVPEEVRQHAPRIAELLSRERVTIWFSGPAILSMLATVEDLDASQLSALRVVAFAGEVFPSGRLNALRQRLSHPRYFNFYGSTETNVALYHELTPGDTLSEPPPIGRPCGHYEARAVSPAGRVTDVGETGELQLRGGDLATGYWDQPALTEEKRAAADDGGGPWYRTGDLVIQLAEGAYRYAGRIGRMLKIRGYRVEPGDSLEVALKKLNAGLQALGARAEEAEAIAPDGLIEAFSVRAATGFALGVQWHPEWKVKDNPASLALFAEFGRAARHYAQR